ncbi:secondary thiamine-phosphate synthase enzyme [Ignicoccus islandicus DSM 13165]|uniref:Secondary thiamine-phosphate synthase enzyme n=1 Tax=Ignicoccus islandicus DSM 13165 TaxID=940295 RepID=A0A0U3FQE8_9CREN|nr:secondary thiamine-phosphate synthase enzyme YjbQ [Ignicoccus islandicus]ALU11680.1 secondary thiamine-phosphate synthase enzyme [Ignicoccus islandicus DSM 13165]
MTVYIETFTVSSSRRKELIDVTQDVERIVKRSNIRNGLCTVFVPHATAAVIANEHESGLMSDILNALEELVPPDKPWRHNMIDNNADAHILASIIGPSRTFPVIEGRLIRGTWQNIFVVELDGPRPSRKVVVTVVGD